jgi:UDP-N-acetylmuramyl pentapeptide phosphotransferase/UDP-N-acetylglucosamine-1-phosphate transferase
LILELLGGAAIAAIASLIACRALIAAGPLDRPGMARKAHLRPTPTSGGLAIAFGFAIGLMALALMARAIEGRIAPNGAHLLTLTSCFAYAFLLLGFIDDAHPLSARLKFVVFTLLSVGAALAMGPLTHFSLTEGVSLKLPYWLGLVGTALWIFTLVNCVNFMDGANGLAMGSAAIGLVALAGVAYAQGTTAGVTIALSGAGALAGFLFWNFPHGKLFAGDSGALVAGALAALASILVIHRTGLAPLIPPILFFPLLADALLTLAWRAIRRRSLFDGHSEHIYQIAIHAGMSHGEIAVIYWAATAACGAIGSSVADHTGAEAVIAILALACAAIIVSVIVRRFAARRGVEGV